MTPLQRARAQVAWLEELLAGLQDGRYSWIAPDEQLRGPDGHEITIAEAGDALTFARMEVQRAERDQLRAESLREITLGRGVPPETACP